MKSTFLPLAPAALLAAAFIPACDPDEDTNHVESFDEDLDADPELVAADEHFDESNIEPLGVLGVETPEPSEAYADCSGAGFCFWEQLDYAGKPYVQPKGDFAVSFPQAIRSARKHQGTYRVKLFSNPNFTGQCAVFGCEGCSATSPKLIFPVRSARRMAPSEPGC